MNNSNNQNDNWMVPPDMSSVSKTKRGFASMDKKKQKEIASKGGRAAHRTGKAHEFTPEEAREAGRKGGMARGRNQT